MHVYRGIKKHEISRVTWETKRVLRRLLAVFPNCFLSKTSYNLYKLYSICFLIIQEQS